MLSLIFDYFYGNLYPHSFIESYPCWKYSIKCALHLGCDVLQYALLLQPAATPALQCIYKITVIFVQVEVQTLRYLDPFEDWNKHFQAPELDERFLFVIASANLARTISILQLKTHAPLCMLTFYSAYTIITVLFFHVVVQLLESLAKMRLGGHGL